MYTDSLNVASFVCVATEAKTTKLQDGINLYDEMEPKISVLKDEFISSLIRKYKEEVKVIHLIMNQISRYSCCHNIVWSSRPPVIQQRHFWTSKWQSVKDTAWKLGLKWQIKKRRMVHNQTPRDRTALNQTPRDRTALNQTPRNRMALSQNPRDRMALNQIPRDRMALNQTPRDRMALNQTPRDRMALSQTLRDRVVLSLVLTLWI